MSKKERIILQNGKTKPVYVTGVILFFAISLAILFGSNLFKGVFAFTVIGWILAGCFTVAAFICARRGRGRYLFTKSRIIYEESQGKVCWELQLADIEDCRQKSLLYSQVFKCYKILLKIKKKDGESDTRDIGPFPMNVANQWKEEVKKQIIGRN